MCEACRVIGAVMADVVIRGGDQGPTKLIDKSFIDSQAYQAYLEAYRNVEQTLERDLRGEGRYWGSFLRGERPQARFVVDALPIENGAVKMVLWNTAPPMSEQEMRAYFTSVGTGHEGAVQYSSTSRDGQLGQGFRQGTLPWNTHGVVAIAVDPLLGGADGASMMWMHKAPLGDDGPLVYSIRALPAYLDDAQVVEDIVVPVQTIHGIDYASLIPVEVAEYGGMVFVLLGNDITEHTFNGAAIKHETGAGICKFLNNATLDGSLCTVTFATTDSSTGGGKRLEIDGKLVRFDRRRIKSYEQWGQDRVRADGSPAVIEQGEVVNPDTGVVYRWMAGPLDLKASRHDVWNGGGFLVAPYKTDVHPVLPSASAADRGYAYGMLAKTAGVVGLQVHLPVRTTDAQAGLYVEQSLDRSRLILASGRAIPWREIGAWFAENLPGPIAALNAEVEAMTVRKTFDLTRFRQRMIGYLSGLRTTEVLVEDPDGDVPGEPQQRQRGTSSGRKRGRREATTPTRRRKRRKKPVELDRGSGSRLGKLVQRARGPEIMWLTGQQWDEQVGEAHEFVAVYRQGVKAVLYVNAEHRLLAHLQSVVAAELREETGLLPDVTYPRDLLEDRIRHHVTCDLLGTIGHVESAYAADPDARQQLLSPEVLTARAAGFDSIAELVKVEIRDMRRLRDAG